MPRLRREYLPSQKWADCLPRRGDHHPVPWQYSSPRCGWLQFTVTAAVTERQRRKRRLHPPAAGQAP